MADARDVKERVQRLFATTTERPIRTEISEVLDVTDHASGVNPSPPTE